MAGDERTVGEILGDPQPVSGFKPPQERKPTFQETVAASLVFGDYGLGHPARVLIKTTDDLEAVQDWSFRLASRVVGPLPVWLRFYRADESNGLLAVIHSPVAANEADLIILADRPGMLTRSVLRAIAGWAFGSCGLSRLVLRVPVGDDRLKDFARRAGCRHEGVACDFYGDGIDASVWSMLARDCRWLGAQPTLAIPTVDISPPSSDRKH